MEAQRDPGSPDLDFDPEIQAACLQALLGLPIEINQRKIVSSPSEAFAPAAEKVAGGRTDPSPIKFSKFTILFFYSGIHRTGSILSGIFFLPFFRSFYYSEIIPKINLAPCVTTL